MPATRSIDVQTFLDEHPFSPFQWLIFALCRRALPPPQRHLYRSDRPEFRWMRSDADR